MRFRFHLDPNREIFRWGPLDGTLITMSYPVFGLFQNLTQTYGKQWWPDGALLSRNMRFIWMQDLPQLLEQSYATFVHFMRDDASRAQVRAAYDAHVRLLQSYAQHGWQNDFADLSDEQFCTQFSEWSTHFRQFWAHAGLPELATWGAADWIEKQLEGLGFSKSDIARVLPILTTPEDISFFQKAERDLLDCIERDVQLEEYRQRWYWIRNSYAGARRMTIGDVEQEIQVFKKRGDIATQKHKIEMVSTQMREQKKTAQEHYRLSDEIMHASRGLGIAIAWQDERKGEQWKQLDVLFSFLRGCEQRFGIPLSDSLWMLPEEVAAACQGQQFAPEILTARKEHCVLGMENATATVLTGDEAKVYIDMLWNPPVDMQQPIQGIVVSKRKEQETLTGVAHRIDSPTEGSAFHDGAILVTAMTTPDFMPIIRRASAIVTDEGGLTAHAAVVSRELGIPCIVGTKNATVRITTGDRITLNLLSGKVSIEASSV